jgi:hypothetical protein
MALSRMVKKGDRVRFDRTEYTITEVKDDGIAWCKSDDGQSTCFIARFHDGTLNQCAVLVSS